MHSFTFEGIGTHWKVLYFVPKEISDVSGWNDSLENDIHQTVELFDRRYSRFKKESLVWEIALSQEKYHTLSDEFADILAFGSQLKTLTNGRFNPAVGFVLENLGYDSEYSFQAKKRDERIALDWDLTDHQLYTPRPVLLDIGAWGKGYLIDVIAHLLETKGITHYLVDGGGDVFATHKPDGAGWRVPIVHPINPEQAFALVELKDSALACTGSTLRNFGEYHHLVDPESRQSLNQFLGVYTQAPTATIADGAATAIFVDAVEHISQLAQNLDVQYLTLTPELQWAKSEGFNGEVFVE
jgi:thiamine biosynthesis lipoprotein